jgi:hypothetical protein
MKQPGARLGVPGGLQPPSPWGAQSRRRAAAPLTHPLDTPPLARRTSTTGNSTPAAAGATWTGAAAGRAYWRCAGGGGKGGCGCGLGAAPVALGCLPGCKQPPGCVSSCDPSAPAPALTPNPQPRPSQEIRALAPDVLCLQEVDRWEEVEADLQQMG